MYNFTNIYILPKDPSLPIKFKFSFYVFQADEYLYGPKYNKISIYISLVGGNLLIFGVIIYLDGHLTVYNIIKGHYQEWKWKRAKLN